MSINTNNEIQFLSILLDGKKVNLTAKELFDKNKYNTAKIITFVSSTRFMSSIIKDFDDIELVLGIDDDLNKKNFSSNLGKYFNIQDITSFYNKLDDESKIKIKYDKLKLFYSHNYTVHDKIYLLSNSETLETRVIIGSANFSASAFLNNKQFETIEVFDNCSERYNYYLERFNMIKDYCVDYLPETLKQLPREIKSEDIETIPVINSTESLNLLLEQRDKLDNASNGKFLISEEVMADIASNTDDFIFIKEEKQKEADIIATLFKKSGKSHKLKTHTEIKKHEVKIKTLISKKSTSVEDDGRIFYKFDNNIAQLFVEEKTLSEDSKEASNVLSIYPKAIDGEVLRENLLNINDIVDSYYIYSRNKNVDIRHKIFEILLYSFMSPFIWKIRDQYAAAKGSETERRYIYPFLIIGGDYESGKSTILDLVGRLIGNNAPFFTSYEMYSKGSTLKALFDTENICPLLVDEIPLNFFTSKKATSGEALIKWVSNNLHGQHPCLIGTTNVRDFSVSGQVLSRILYMEINNAFDPSKSEESKSTLDRLRRNTDDTLFRDFCFKMVAKIKNNEDIFSSEDILKVGRDIFVEYYNQCGIEVPEWVSYQAIIDYQKKGRDVWAKWYLNNKDHFKKSKDDTLFVNTNELWKTSADVEKYLNFLDKESYKDFSRPMLLLNEKAFYKFIGINETPFEKVMRFIKK